jgi:hypothetical protein
MKRTPFRRKEGPTAAKEPRPLALASVLKPLRRGTYGGSTTGPAPKSEAYRDSVLLEMARGRACLLLVPGFPSSICNGRTDTTVAAHSNLSIHGKAGARKADDCYSAWACAACHFWLDQGRAPADEKAAAFMGAHSRQVLAWRQIAQDPTEPQRFRAAARRALLRLAATAIDNVKD